MEPEKPKQPQDIEGWNDHVRTLGTVSLRDSCILLNPEIMHKLFGSVAREKFYHVYMVKDLQTKDGNLSFKLVGSFHDNLAKAFDAIQEIKPSQCWYYIPDKKYVIYVEGCNFLCVDYGNFDDADTLVIECLKLPRHPLTNFADLQFIINNCHGFVSVVRERKRLLEIIQEDPLKPVESVKPSVDASRTCNFCGRTHEKELLVCVRCKAAYYCDRTCQGKDIGNHKKVCVKAVKRD